ncbi:MAG: hypothetical protein IJP14_06105, partial [Clostridia bacterium]|nr:hypothetical protein [Clostridia bacterium]
LTVTCAVLVTWLLCSCSAKPMGRIVTQDDFVAEFSKRTDLSAYTMESAGYEETFEYTYTAKTACEIKKAKRNFQVEIDGIRVTLPLTVKELTELGFELVAIYGGDQQTVDLSVLERCATFDVRTPDGNTFTIYAANKANELIPIEDLTVMQVACAFYEGDSTYGVGERNDAPDIRFFKGVTGASTVDSVMKELKTPQVIYFSRTEYNGETTLTNIQMTFAFSNKEYRGDLCVSAKTLLDDTVKQTSYITDLSYRIDIGID